MERTTRLHSPMSLTLTNRQMRIVKLLVDDARIAAAEELDSYPDNPIANVMAVQLEDINVALVSLLHMDDEDAEDPND